MNSKILQKSVLYLRREFSSWKYCREVQAEQRVSAQYLLRTFYVYLKQVWFWLKTNMAKRLQRINKSAVQLILSREKMHWTE